MHPEERAALAESIDEPKAVVPQRRLPADRKSQSKLRRHGAVRPDAARWTASRANAVL